MLEWTSIAQGLLAADAMAKEAEITFLALRPVTPGRFVALFRGSVEAVRRSLGRGAEIGGAFVLDSLFLALPHPTLLPTLSGQSQPKVTASVGIIETSSLCSALLAADGAAKTAAVQLLEMRLAMGLGGKAFFTFTGAQSDVESALHAGTQLARERGQYVNAVVLPNPDARLRDAFMQSTIPFSDFLIA